MRNILLDWMVALCFRSDVTRIDVAPAHEQRTPESSHAGPPGPTRQSVA